MTPVFSTNRKRATTTAKPRRRIGEYNKEVREFKKSLSVWERIQMDVKQLSEENSGLQVSFS